MLDANNQEPYFKYHRSITFIYIVYKCGFFGIFDKQILIIP